MSVSSATFSAALTAFLMVKDSKRKLPYLAQVLLTVEAYVRAGQKLCYGKGLGGIIHRLRGQTLDHPVRLPLSLLLG